MKVLVFSPYYTPHIGGLETHSEQFNHELSFLGTEVLVFTSHIPSYTPDKEYARDGVKIIRFPAFEIVSNYPLPKFWKIEFWKLFLSLFREKIDIVISRTRFFNTSLMALVYAKAKNKKWIHIEHGSDFVELSSNFKTLMAKLYDITLGRLIFKTSSMNISISKAVKVFVQKFDDRESPIIYRGIDIVEIEKISPDIEFKKKFKDKIVITWAGRIYKWKGVENTIKAINILPDKIKKKMVFVIIGDGEDIAVLKKISNDLVFFTGSLPRKKVLGIFKISDIYVHSSVSGGGLSTSLLEAMLCGCSVIATPNEGANEVVENEKSGLLLKDNSPELLSEKISLMCQNEEIRREFSSKSKGNIENNFSWDKAMKEYLKYVG